MANITKIKLEDSNNFNRIAGGKVKSTVTFSEDVLVTGNPYVNMVVDMTNGPAVSEGNNARVAWLDYVSGSGTDELVFETTLGAEDLKSGQNGDALKFGPNALVLNGGTIKDRAGVDATITNSQAIADAAGTCEVYTPA
jgi:large repetitive protein